jgi:hypothetical protein
MATDMGELAFSSWNGQKAPRNDILHAAVVSVLFREGIAAYLLLAACQPY